MVSFSDDKYNYDVELKVDRVFGLAHLAPTRALAGFSEA